MMMQKSNEKLVSIIIPTHNGSKVIRNAVNSVLNQTYTKFEIIVVDDNGIGTKEQINTKQQIADLIKLGKVKYITHKVCKNGAAARNTGFRFSKGEYITLLDDDDEYLKNKIYDQVNLFEKLDSKYGLVYCGAFVMNDCNRLRINRDTGDVFFRLLIHDLVIGSDCLMVRRECWSSLNGFNESFVRHQDFEFTARVAAQWKIKALNVAGVVFHELKRHEPKDKSIMFKNRVHYLKSMLPLMNIFNIKRVRMIVSINLIQLVGNELRSLKLFEAFKLCEAGFNSVLDNYSIKDFFSAIVYVIYMKTKSRLNV